MLCMFRKLHDALPTLFCELLNCASTHTLFLKHCYPYVNVCSLVVSIDAYRTQRQSKLPIVQSVTPGVQRRAEETPKPQPPVNIKEKITVCSLL